ncbi:MAG: response regulator, partial [Nitrospinota bacterium]|nr:response regulator [Nitrospinota bacterium]
FSNIMHNAIKFSFPQTSIRVYTPADQRDCVAIRDMGMGMDEATRLKLFMHDSRVSNPGTQGERGTGLGLALSQDIMSAHGGLISVTSSPGQGSEFLIKFPESTPTLMIVDDDEDFRLLMRSDLESLKLKIVEAESGISAMQLCRLEQLSLVITDMEMPGMDGCELTGMIKNETKSHPVPVIMVSVNSDYQAKLRALKHGADDFLIKPVERNALLLAVRKYVTI